MKPLHLRLALKSLTTVVQRLSGLSLADNGSDRKWEPMSYTLAIGGCTLLRCHIRLFDGGYDERLGDFTLGNVHYEQSYSLTKIHIVQDWDKSRDFVRRSVEATSFYKHVREERFTRSEVVQNVSHDGIACIMELQ